MTIKPGKKKIIVVFFCVLGRGKGEHQGIEEDKEIEK